MLRPQGGTLTTDLTVDYHDTVIAGCQTHLRGYDGALVGKTLRVRPGDTLSISLRNRLLPEPGPQPSDINTPHNFNTTNFHSHGLHVSPSGNADNVLRLMPPQSTSLVEIHIPQDHPTGTFWYHSHVHGSTALQVSSGMAGAIIVENPDDPRSLDSVPEIRAAKDQVLLLICRSGQRSAAAALAATAAGFSQVFQVLEGFEGELNGQQQRGKKGGWRFHGLPWVQD